MLVAAPAAAAAVAPAVVRPLRPEAIGAIDRPVAPRLEGNGGLLATGGASRRIHFPVLATKSAAT